MLPADYMDATTWHIPKRFERGDPENAPIYRAVGYSLSQWEGLEISLGSLFAVLVESKSRAATRAYGALASAQARSDAIEQAADVFFGTHDSKNGNAFAEMLKVVRWAQPRRNDIAHGIAVSYARSDAIGGGHFLVAPNYNTRRTEAFIDIAAASDNPFDLAPHKYAYTSSQIEAFGVRFHFLDGQVANLAHAISRELNPRPRQPPFGKSAQPLRQSPPQSGDYIHKAPEEE